MHLQNKRMDGIKSQFLLENNIVFLNHGSFGACPKPVFKTYQQWQCRLEEQPVLFLGREYPGLYAASQSALSHYVHTKSSDIVYVTNATEGVNIVAKSLDLRPGDEILSTNHEYGACDNIWMSVCNDTGARYIRQEIHLPVQSWAMVLENLMDRITPKTRMIYLSHITSPTAQCFPVEEICKAARERGVLTLIDGAHAPGQLDLDISKIDPDFYTGNCHKWMLSPKGAGFLYARQNVQHLLKPLVTSWGWSGEGFPASGSRFIDLFQWTGTRDPAALLSVPAAIDFMHMNQWKAHQVMCHEMLSWALAEIEGLFGEQPAYIPQVASYHQMGIARLPSNCCDAKLLQKRLYDEYRVEVPLIEWNGAKYIRISVQAYNSQNDINILLDGLKKLTLNNSKKK